MSTVNNWISVQTVVNRFNSCTPHKPVVSKTSEAGIWWSSYDHLTNVKGQWGGSQRVHAFYSTRKKLYMNWSKRMMMKRGMVDKQGVYGSQLKVLSNPGLQTIGSNVYVMLCILSVWHPGLIPAYQNNSYTLLFSGLRSP